MYVYRQYVWLCIAIFLPGCVGTDPTPLIYGRSPFSHAAQQEGFAHCAPLFGNGQFARLAGKMPVLPSEMPTRDMLSINVAPNSEEISAIQALEGAMRTCRQMRAAAGVPTSATEDILNARISRLRYGLYRGDIPYAVYNYGVAQAFKSYNNFVLEGEKTAQTGRQIGRDKESLAIGQSMMLMTMLNAYNSQAAAAPKRHWNCSTTTLDTSVYVDCY